VDSTAFEFREKLLQFAVAHQRVAADDGKMYGFFVVDKVEEAPNQLVAFVVG